MGETNLSTAVATDTAAVDIVDAAVEDIVDIPEATVDGMEHAVDRIPDSAFLIPSHEAETILAEAHVTLSQAEERKGPTVDVVLFASDDKWLAALDTRNRTADVAMRLPLTKAGGNFDAVEDKWLDTELSVAKNPFSRVIPTALLRTGTGLAALRILCCLKCLSCLFTTKDCDFSDDFDKDGAF